MIFLLVLIKVTDTGFIVQPLHFVMHYNGSPHLCVFIHLSIGVIRDDGGVEEVEEAIRLDLLGHCPNAALGLVLLLLLDGFDCQVLVGLPVDGASLTSNKKWKVSVERS